MTRKNFKILISSATILLSLFSPLSAKAETVIEKVRSTGILTAGVRKDGFPLTFQRNQRWEGYSVDLIKLIKKELEAELKKPIQINFVEVTAQNRIPLVVANTIDIVCDSTSFTWHRSRFVDFSIPYFITGTQLLVKANSGLNTLESLQLKKIGAISSSTNELEIIQKLGKAILVPVNNGEEGFSALEKGEIDAFAWDGVLLAGLKKNMPNATSVNIIPNQPLDSKGCSCIIPENNSDFSDIVDYTLVKFMQGIIDNQSEDVAIFRSWFSGSDYDYIINYFREQVNSRERIPLKSPQN
jgi:polar amino acid transport system substrate-binding protein